MGIFDFFKKKAPKIKGVELTREEIEEQIKQAWWDLYVSNLPNPIVVDAENDKNVPEMFKDGVPRGFSIDPENWTIYFNKKDVPTFATIQEAKDYCRSIGQHETTHWTILPSSKRMNVRLVDSGLKGLRREHNPEIAKGLAHLTVNVLGDWMGDGLLGTGKYGREDFSKLTRDRLKATVEDVAKQQKNYSALWKVLVGTYERILDESIGLDKHCKLSYSEERDVEDCFEILGTNFRDSSQWPEKTRRLAGILERIVMEDPKNQKSDKSEKGSGDGISLPDDAKKQLGPNPDKSPLNPSDKKQNGSGNSQKDYRDEKFGEQRGANETNVDGEILDEVYKLNKDNPGQFAGTLSAFTPVEPKEAIRLMYRARAREYLIKITEKKDKGSYKTPGHQETWNVGDPILGRGGLQIVPSMMSTGVIIPGTTTVKRRAIESDLPGRVRQIADLEIIIDSSGSMEWDPTAQNEEYRGPFDKAILAAEAATLYALDHGAKVAIVNFSGEEEGSGKRQIRYCAFTNNLGLIERTLMFRYGGGTIFPIEEVDRLMKKNKSRVVTCAVSDFDLNNPNETFELVKKHTNNQNPFYMFDIGGMNKLTGLDEHPGVTRFKIKNMNDLKGVVIGRLKEDYER